MKHYSAKPLARKHCAAVAYLRQGLAGQGPCQIFKVPTLLLWPKTWGRRGLKVNSIYFGLLAKKTLGPKVYLEHIFDVFKSFIQPKCLQLMCARIYCPECTRIALMKADFSKISWWACPQTPLVWVC